MWVLVALLAVSLASIAFVAIRNRIMFKMGVRNIPRRRAQTTLIVLGLMLSTIIISAAFTTGDTVDRSLTSEVYRLLGSVDQVVQISSSEEEDSTFDDPNQGVTREQSFAQQDARPLIDSMRRIANVQAVVPAYSDVAVAVNTEEGVSSPLFNLLGLDPGSIGDLPDLQEVGGGRLSLADLGPNEIYLNRSAAEELNLGAGDPVTLYTQNVSQVLRVRAVVEDRRLAGAAGISVRREGGVMQLERVQQFFGQPGRLTQILVSNEGDARGGLTHSEAVTEQLRAELARAPELGLSAVTIKRTGVHISEEGANFFTTFFLVLGLFSIGAGVLLIFMIFVMLAAERKSEMGMARAVGTKRMDLVQTFLSEGMAYNVLAAAVGTGLGVLVAFLMTRILAGIFAEFDITISPYVTLRSLVISYSLGVVLTFLTVTFSSWRVSYINIVRAIRDIPEPPQQGPQWGSGGFFPTLLRLVFRPTDRAGWLRRAATVVALVLAGAGAAFWPLLLVAGLIILGVFASYALSQTTLPPLFKAAVFTGAVLVTPLSIAAGLFMTLQLGPLFLAGGLVLIAISGNSAFLLLFGLSLAPLGLALLIRSFGANERITYTLTGLLLIYIWEFDFSVGLIERIFGETEGDIEMFFLSGVMVTIAATFLVVYNADLILGPLNRAGQGLGALLPSLKMAIAYPLANRTRTGMTMAMFCLVVFALTVMSSMNHNFERLFLSDEALGGWQITVDENPTNPISDLRSDLTAAGSPAIQNIEAVGVASIVTLRKGRLCHVVETRTCQPTAGSAATFSDYAVRGLDDGFLADQAVPLQQRARGYSNDQAVWDAVSSNPRLAVIDSFALAGDFGAAPVIAGVDTRGQEIDPLTIVMRNPIDGRSETLQVIGIISMGASGTYNGLHVQQSTMEQVYGQADTRRFFVKTSSGADNREVARQIEAALLTTGAQAESLRYQIDRQNATFSGFFYLMQGFMGLGLLVGVAAVGVIAFRTVVERRQQIGMLRAIGYTRKMIGLTFLFESAFIAFMGILSGIVFALILARQLITDEFANQGATSFAIPWPQVLIIAGLAFGFALLMTLIPSRQAANIPIAQALRYE